MSSLASCIKKAGKALDKDDAAAIRQIHDDLVAAGAPNPAEQAVAEFLAGVRTEGDAILAEIRAKGGDPRTGVRLKAKREDAIARAISSVGLLNGEETLEIEGASTTKAGKPKVTAQQLAKALVDRTKAANRGKALDARTARSKAILSEALALETEAAINRSGHAGDWYSTVLHNAVNIISEIHPELKTDNNARSMFLLGLAITSNGLDVSTNSRSANEVYETFKTTGRFPEKGFGDKGPAMRQAFTMANELIERWGLTDFTRFLNTEFTVGELNQLGFQVSGEAVDHVTHGSVIFGPKIGGGFYQNLQGNYSPLTMDRWFMRTWGRLTGSLLPDTSQLPQAQVERFSQTIMENPEAVKEMGYDPQKVLEDDNLMLELASKVHRAYAKSGFKDKTDLNKAGKNLDLAMNAPIIAPRTGTERAWIREVAAEALEKLKQRGRPVNAASMQALVWYPEKDLYLQYGVGNAKSVPTDYEREFEKLALELGIDQPRIEAARTGDPDKRPAGDVGPDSGERGSVEVDAAPRLDPKERQHLLQKAVTARVRQQFPRPYARRLAKGKRAELSGAKVTAVYKPAIAVRNAYTKVGMSTPEFLELDPVSGAELFTQKILAAKEASPAGAAVYVYPQEEYESMRLFMTEGGEAGFALNGDDIVSVFKAPGPGMPNVAQAAIGLAVAEGGRRLDAFDTVLPSIYSMQGFKVVSRLPWDETQAPPDWNKKQFSRWNDGEPDVVFMAYDSGYMDAYAGQAEGQLVEDYDEAARLQLEARDALDQRNRRSLLLSLPGKKPIIDRVNRDPEGPLSQLHKLGATVEDQAGAGQTTVSRNMIREFWESKRINWLLASVPRRNLSDFLPREHAPSVERYIRQANRMAGRRNELMMKYEETARKWAKWARGEKRMAGRLSDVMHAATLAGVDPSKPYQPLKNPAKMSDDDKRVDALRREQYTLLQGHWGQLDATGQEIYKEVRDNYIGQRKDLEGALMARIDQSEAEGSVKRALMDKLRKQFEAGRVAGPYFPLMRYGDLWAVAKDDKGEVVAYSRFENRESQKQWVKEFKDSGYQTDQGRRSEEDADLVKQVDPQFAARVAQLVKDSADPQLADEIWQMYLQSLPEMSMRKRFMHRKGRLGFAADALRAYANVSFRGAHQQAKLEYMHRMHTTLNDLKDEVRAIEGNPALEKEFNWAMPVYDEMVRRHKLAANPSASPIAVNITGAGFLWWLGFTPAAAAVNLTQTAIVGLPVLAGAFNALGATRELLSASKLFAASRGRVENKLRGDEYRAFEEARRIGLFEKTQAHDLAGVTETGAQEYGSAWHRTMEIGSWMFHHAEQFNREVTFLAGYRLARQKGISHDDAVVMAEDLVWDAHFDYNNDNRPRWMQGNVARVITLFKQYSLNMTYRLVRDFNDSLRGATPEQRRAARKRFGGMMMMTALFSGFTGLPAILSQTIPYVLENILGDDDEPFDALDSLRAYLSEMFGPKAAEVIMKGPWDALTGMTLSSRVSLANLWWRDPGIYDQDEQVFMHIMMEILGPIPTTVQDIVVSGQAMIEDGHPQRGLEKMTPKFMRDIFRAYRFTTEGALTMHTPPDMLLAPEQFNEVDLFWQAFGFTPAKLTMQYEQNEAIRRADMALRDRRQYLMDRFMLAAFNQDKTGVRDALIAIGKWNIAQPPLAIDTTSISRGMNNRMERSARSIGGVTLDKKTMHLYRDLLFTEQEKLKTSDGTEEE